MVLAAAFVAVVLFVTMVLTVMLVVTPVLPVLASAVPVVVMPIAAMENLGNPHRRPPLHLDLTAAEPIRQPWRRKPPAF
jgi:hypothetical protein